MILPASDSWSPLKGGITVPVGFKASGIKAGLKASGKADLALLYAFEGTSCAGVFTQSSVRAACIDLSIARLQESSGKIRAVLINSGQANACIGNIALADNLLITEALADLLGLKKEEVLICSTGVIGKRIPIKKVLAALPSLVEQLSFDGGSCAANAILTTDLKKKEIAYEAYLGDRKVCIGGMAKGSGMIHPNMATMLGYISCDVGVSSDLWKPMIRRVANCSFNAISVDGDTSTNDAFLAFSSGELIDEKYLKVLELGLTKAAQYLAKAIVRDGEGAHCLFEVEVEGASTTFAARQMARVVSSSSLVKTAIHGVDPNWGRIVAALGMSGHSFQINHLCLWIGPYQLMKDGIPISFNRIEVSDYMKKRMNGEYLIDDSISIRLIIGNGPGKSLAWGCDLSDEYIRINADYTT